MARPTRFAKLLLIVVLLCPLTALAQEDTTGEPAEPWVPDRPWESIDLVIALDTSDSMQSLIDAARLSLWDIVNELMTAEPQPHLRVALLAYGSSSYGRDAGWVSIETDLTTDLDHVSERLFELTTSGGTEYVARALQTAVEKLSWTPSYDALKLVFVAGNEPADQDPEVDLEDAGRLAIDEGISITAIYCGSPEAEQAATWKELAERAEGRFAAVDRRGGGTAKVTTPFDDQLARLSAALNETYVPLGDDGRQRAESLGEQDGNAAKLSPAAAAARARTKANPRFSSGWDLISKIESGETTVYEVDEQKLPEALRRLNPEERELFVDDLVRRRRELRRQIAELSEKRRRSVDEQVEAKGLDVSSSFESAVREAIRAQAADKGFELPEY